METLKQLENALKRKDRTQDDIVKYLLASKEEMNHQTKRFIQTKEFQVVRRKLRELNNK